MASDDDIPLKSVAKHFPSRPSKRTIYRWVYEGVLDRDSPTKCRIYLETVLQGGRRYTSEEKIDRFDQRVNSRRLKRRTE